MALQCFKKIKLIDMMNAIKKNNVSWFDSPYYHILYKYRDDKEAKCFMDNLIQYLKIPKGAKILDLACGKGRHSIYLQTVGFQVTGVDLSEQSILDAKQFENENLRFAVHNMTQPYPDTFDAVFNLFTSFGYSENDNDNIRTIEAIKAALNKEGIGVIDFMNVNFVMKFLIQVDIKTVDGIDFHQKRGLKNGFIVKDIGFQINGEHYEYQEKVKALTLDDFKRLFEQAELQLLDVFGDYNLSKYDSDYSERLIMIFKS